MRAGEKTVTEECQVAGETPDKPRETQFTKRCKSLQMLSRRVFFKAAVRMGSSEGKGAGENKKPEKRKPKLFHSEESTQSQRRHSPTMRRGGTVERTQVLEVLPRPDCGLGHVPSVREDNIAFTGPHNVVLWPSIGSLALAVDSDDTSVAPME